MEKCYINGKERYGFTLIYKLADEETYPSNKYYLTYCSKWQDTGPETFVTPTGWWRKQRFLSFSTRYLCSQKAQGRKDVGRGCHVSSLCTQLPNQTEPEGLILALSALALSLSVNIFIMHHNEVLCSSLAGFFPKAPQGQGEHNSELETHQRQEPS